jgi:hypothetical protein
MIMCPHSATCSVLFQASVRSSIVLSLTAPSTVPPQSPECAKDLECSYPRLVQVYFVPVRVCVRRAESDDALDSTVFGQLPDIFMRSMCIYGSLLLV